MALDPEAALDRLDAIWSDDFDAYASGQLDASQVHCALCTCAPCRCPAFGSAAYFALVDFRHGRTRRPTPKTCSAPECPLTAEIGPHPRGVAVSSRKGQVLTSAACRSPEVTQ
jgi:hypothetical protein